MNLAPVSERFSALVQYVSCSSIEKTAVEMVWNAGPVKLSIQALLAFRPETPAQFRHVVLPFRIPTGPIWTASVQITCGTGRQRNARKGLGPRRAGFRQELLAGLDSEFRMRARGVVELQTFGHLQP